MKKSKKVLIILAAVALVCAAGGGAVYYGFFMDQAERSAVADFVRSLIQDKVAPYAILALAAVLSVIECTRPWLTRISQAVARILTGQSAFESAARTAAGMESESRRAVEAMQAFEAAQEERAGRMEEEHKEALLRLQAENLAAYDALAAAVAGRLDSMEAATAYNAQTMSILSRAFAVAFGNSPELVKAGYAAKVMAILGEVQAPPETGENGKGTDKEAEKEEEHGTENENRA